MSRPRQFRQKMPYKSLKPRLDFSLRSKWQREKPTPAPSQEGNLALVVMRQSARKFYLIQGRRDVSWKWNQAFSINRSFGAKSATDRRPGLRMTSGRRPSIPTNRRRKPLSGIACSATSEKKSGAGTDRFPLARRHAMNCAKFAAVPYRLLLLSSQCKVKTYA